MKQKKPVADVATRWGSTYKMIARIIEQQQAICAVLAEDRKNWHQIRMPSDSEFSVLEAVAAILRPLSVFTDALSGEKSVTVSAIRPLLNHIIQDLLHVSLDDCAIIKEKKISDKLQARYISQEISDFLDKCSYLDPRFQEVHLADKDRTLGHIQSEAVSNSEAVSIADELRISRGSSSTDDKEAEGPPAPKKLKGLGAILKKLVKDKPSDEHLTDLSSSQKVERERQCYLRTLTYSEP